MPMPEQEWLSINEVAGRLRIPQKLVEHYLDIGKLIASIKVPPTLICFMDLDAEYDEYQDKSIDVPCDTELHEGIFKILRYDRIRWDQNNCCDLHKNKVRISKLFEGDTYYDDYEFASSYTISKDEIIIEKESLVSFIEEVGNDLSLPRGSNALELFLKQGTSYLDYNNPFFSEELATAVNVWMRVFDCAPDKPSNRSFKEDIESILNNRRDLSAEAKERLAIVINPDAFKKGGRKKTTKKEEN